MAETWVSMPELELLLGKDAARTLCRLRGGTPFFVPQKPAPAHLLAGVVGIVAMATLCREFPGEYITVPNGRKAEPHKSEIINRLEKGYSHASIALEFGVTERYVRMVASNMPTMRQLTLPL